LTIAFGVPQRIADDRTAKMTLVVLRKGHENAFYIQKDYFHFNYGRESTSTSAREYCSPLFCSAYVNCFVFASQCDAFERGKQRFRKAKEDSKIELLILINAEVLFDLIS
jgi:hypothetical protein